MRGRTLGARVPPYRETSEEFRFWGKAKYSGKREFILGVWGVGVSPFSILGKVKGP